MKPEPDTETVNRYPARVAASVLFLMLVLLTALNPAVVNAEANKATVIPLQKPYPAPDFKLSDMDGKVYHLKKFRGKVVVINFWATWCPPCVYEMPAMNRTWHKLKNRNFIILAINVGEDEDAIFSFTGKYPADFPLIMDKEAKVIQQWKTIVLPTTYIINKKGMVVYKAVGGREWDKGKVFRIIKSLL